jgi:hypothetical protein
MIFGYEEVIKSAKPGQNKFKEINAIIDEINSVFNTHHGDNFPFCVRGGAQKPGTEFNVIALQTKSVFSESGFTGKIAAAALAKVATHTYAHQFIEIKGNNGCIYTIGLGTAGIKDAAGNDLAGIAINDFAFNLCKKKNKICFDAINANGRYEYEGHVINDIPGCNQMCGQMIGMRQDGRNNYTPIGTVKKTLSTAFSTTYLDIDHLKFIKTLIENSNLVSNIDPFDGTDTPLLVILPKGLGYDMLNSMQFKQAAAVWTLRTVGAKLGKDTDVLCAKDGTTNCRVFSESFRDDITGLLEDFKKYLPSLPNRYETDMGDLYSDFPIIHNIVVAARTARS